MSKSLFDQLSAGERGAVAGLVGGTEDAGFRNFLRATPAIPEPFVMGEAARAYLTARIAALSVPIEGDEPKSTALKNEVLDVDGSKWLVREAVSREAALDSIAMARCTGSVGSMETSDDNGVKTVCADVVRLNDDGSERKPS